MTLVMETYVPCKYYGKEKGLYMIRQAGFDGVDFSFYDMEEGDNNIGEMYLEEAYASKSLLEQYGLSCNQTHAPYGFRYGYPMDRSEPTYDRIIRSMEASAILGAKQIVVHGIAAPTTVEEVQANIAFYSSLEVYCRKFQIKIAVENLIDRINCPEMHNAILEKLDPAWFTALVDTGHALLAGYPVETYISQILPSRFCGVHISDNLGYDDDHMLPGIGIIHWENVIQALKSCGYSGEFTLECVNFLECYAKKGLLTSALKMNHDVGRYFANQLIQNETGCCIGAKTKISLF